ncbi:MULTISPECIES: twin-arginine translocase TatA/TatE family subunit [unclassified Streptomyces]|uniref:twin-arginine translocase TatA/TatE family subunit n=1 Tax=unclassified Streptomyces TaxID=2593676 RepID=UPI002877A50B|nr:twin-arginine translocase TatA/TatE family subunit [Streptomyces sp. BB1-1-1]WND34991.1 twin-arginine translocase TatA/TatE family subunit [Streptomyces sp. BB1-1-1]
MIEPARNFYSNVVGAVRVGEASVPELRPSWKRADLVFGLSELALVLLVVIVVLGAKKGPELMRSVGKAARILKSEKKALKDDDR